jgi:hypothetical protein
VSASRGPAAVEAFAGKAASTVTYIAITGVGATVETTEGEDARSGKRM